MAIFSDIYFLALHIQDALVFPKQLTPDEEEKLIDEMENGSETARKKLIEHNLRLVSHISKKYYSKSNDHDELISIGTIGLVKGVNSFKKEKNTKLSTYLAKCIQNEILMNFRTQKKASQDVYISDPIDIDSEGNPLTLMDIIAVNDTISDDIDMKIKIKQLYKFIDEIDDAREKAVIEKRYGLNNNEELTQREIAKELGISRSYVSRIEKKVINDLRIKFKCGMNNGLNEDLR